ncbi:MAG TPA: plastocyanin/azurin family copper-binding protein [Dehalococcoidia bacterium]|jgi:plastocyanin|nr:plastocyanin/azurin family copper-binding protein [Dehalococcoidia bacterium]
MRYVTLAASAALIAIVASAALVLDGGPEAGAQTTANVAIGDNWFCDVSFAGATCDTNITAGDTVLWTNTGTNPHTVTECGNAFTPCPQPGGFASLTLTNGQTFSLAFPTAGTYEYFCNIHGNTMQGRVIVAAAQQTATPSPSPTPGPTTSGASGTSPTATRTTAVPAVIVGAGGTPADSGPSWLLVLAMAGGAFLVASASIGVLAFRQR